MQDGSSHEHEGADKLPHFPCYPSDLLASCSAMSAAEFGAYFRLLCHCWMSGGLPAKRDDELRRMAGAERDEWPALWEAIAPRFTLADGRYTQRRMEAERAKAVALVERRRAGGKLTAAKRWAKPEAQEQTPPTPPAPQSDSSANSSATSPASSPAVASRARAREKIDTLEVGDRESEGKGTVEPAAAAPPTPPRKTSGRKRPSTALPDDFDLTQTRRGLILKHLPGADAAAVIEHFRAHHKAKDSRFSDWDQALLTWVLRDKESGRYPRTGQAQQRTNGGSGFGYQQQPAPKTDPWQTDSGRALLTEGKRRGFRPPHPVETPAGYRTAMRNAELESGRTPRTLDLGAALPKGMPKI